MQTEQTQDTGLQEESINSDAYDSGFDSIDDSGATIEPGPQKEEESGESADGETTQVEQQDGVVPEEFQNTHYYKSMFGRIEKERIAREAAEEKVRRYEASQTQAQQDKPPVFERADIPEELKEDVALFKRDFPEFAEIVELKGKDGDHLRSLLSDYGSGVAAVQAKNILNDLKIQQAESRRDQEEKRRASQAIEEGKEYHRAYVFDAHPDIAKMNESEISKFVSDVEAWAKDQPYMEAIELLRIHERGTAKETAELFRRFKESGYNKPTQHNTIKNKRSQAIEDGLAVKTGSRQINPNRKADSGDYGGGWNSIPD